MDRNIECAIDELTRISGILERTGDESLASQVDEVMIELGECLKPDMRWRPMRTAPRDGTVIELLDTFDGQEMSIWWPWTEEDQKTLATAKPKHNPYAWRPAHPEWNEDDE